MDVYWAVVGGVSPVEYMKKYPGRFDVIHIKDKNELRISLRACVKVLSISETPTSSKKHMKDKGYLA